MYSTAQVRHNSFILMRKFLASQSRRHTDHLDLAACDADLARVRAAHQRIILVYKRRGIRRPLDGSHVNPHVCAINIEGLQARQRQSHDGTCEMKR